MAIRDLMRLIDYKNEKSFRDNYIKPLRETGLIVLTNPDKPTSPENKYTITDSGKAFLGGL
jgi:predicted transcriptional regulator